METTNDESEHYTLYIFPFSLYSIMARFTIALGRAHQGESTARSPPKISLKLLNLHRDENLEEDFLLHINPKGQVPVLTSEGRETLTDSLDISYFLCREYFPEMLPKPHEQKIRELLSKLHAIQGMSVSVNQDKITEQRAVEMKDPKLEELLAIGDHSDGYRKALLFKKQYYDQTIAFALRPENVAKARAQVTDLFQDLTAVHQEHNQPADHDGLWLFGPSAGPTVLDAHAAALIARLVDARHEDLVPEELLAIAQKVTTLPAWKDVTKGRSTIWNVGYGHVASLGPDEI